MTTTAIATLLCGLIFVFLGYAASRHHRWRKFKTYLPLILGTFLILISTVGPLSKGKRAVAKVRNLSSNDVSSIVILPIKESGYKSIVSQNFTITDSNLISLFCHALNHTEIVGEDFLKNPDKVGSIQFNLKDNSSILIGIRKRGRATRLDINSNGEYGWHYAVLSAPGVGNITDSIVK